jgi:ketosteroid isomerase-like protein
MTRTSSPPSGGSSSRSSNVAIPARDRSASGRGSEGRRALAPTIARWPLDVDDGFERSWNDDAAVAIVRRSLGDYRSGRADLASRVWHDDITWRVRGLPPVGGQWTGPEGVFAYHALLERLSRGTFRQHLVALEGCRASIANAYLRTTATRDGRRLEIPTLAVFELAGGRVRCVTEMPGDQAAWEAFWAD